MCKEALECSDKQVENRTSQQKVLSQRVLIVCCYDKRNKLKPPEFSPEFSSLAHGLISMPIFMIEIRHYPKYIFHVLECPSVEFTSP